MKLDIYLIFFSISFSFMTITISSESPYKYPEWYFKPFYDDYGYPTFCFSYGWILIGSKARWKTKYFEDGTENLIPF